MKERTDSSGRPWKAQNIIHPDTASEEDWADRIAPGPKRLGRSPGLRTRRHDHAGDGEAREQP